MNKFLFKAPLTTANGAYDVTFNVNQNSEVLATVEDSSGPKHKDVGLVDLSGRKMHVPRTIYHELYVSGGVGASSALLSFKRICLARLKWSVGCFAIL